MQVLSEKVVVVVVEAVPEKVGREEAGAAVEIATTIVVEVKVEIEGMIREATRELKVLKSSL
jgi:hypothetical protein